MAVVVESPPDNAGDRMRRGFDSWVERIPWRRAWQPNPFQYSCLENPHGQRSLTGYSPQGHKGSQRVTKTGLKQLSVHARRIQREESKIREP